MDAVSAEDIGQFPDASIGDALSRIPGVTVNRGSINAMASAGAPTATGQVTGVTVRGFGTQFNEVLVESPPGSPPVTARASTSRPWAPNTSASSTFTRRQTSPSPGVRSARRSTSSRRIPFDHVGLQARAFSSADELPEGRAVTRLPAFGALFSDTFADDTIGILIAGDYTDKHIALRELILRLDCGLESGAYLPCPSFATDPAGSRAARQPTPAPSDAGQAPVPSWYIAATRPCTSSSTDYDGAKTDGVALQWRPTRMPCW